uniref:Myb/SANT-like DNA-binding domain-containing protein n=1 Tax=Amphimedon queenslandica TaxID=400682 RepID=A0A1X7TRH7_AMPQE
MARSSSWTDKEITALISIWGDTKIQEKLDGSTRNKTIFIEISEKLEATTGISREWQQCRSKIKNLKTEYKRIKDHNNITGNGRKTFQFFKQMDSILGDRPASLPTVLIDTSKSQDTEDFNDSDDDDDEVNHEFEPVLAPTVDSAAARSNGYSEPPTNKRDENG